MKPVDYEGDRTRVYSGAGTGDTFGETMNRRFSRRTLVAGGAVTGTAVIGSAAVTEPSVVLITRNNNGPIGQ